MTPDTFKFLVIPLLVLGLVGWLAYTLRQVGRSLRPSSLPPRPLNPRYHPLWDREMDG